MKVAKVAAAFAAVLVLGTRSIPVQGQTPERLPFAREDLDALADTLLARHPKLSLVRPRREFMALYRQIRLRIGTLPRDRAILEMARLVAQLHDGHTQLGLFWDPRIGFHRLPIRVYLFDDGVFVTRADTVGRRILGKRIVAIGGVPIGTLMERMRPYLHGDNESANKDILATRLILVELLHAVGATTTSGVTVLVVDSAGVPDSVSLHPVDMTAATPELSVLAGIQLLPLYLRHSTDTYWFTPIAGTTTMYAQINAMQSDSAYSFRQFCDSLFRTLSAAGTTSLILDLRLNNGGDNSLDDELVQRVIRSDVIDRPDHLFVIIGRKTFSAAVNLAAELERHTAATFAGEPSAAPANHYGETQRIELPHNRFALLLSSLFWQSGDPRDTRAAILPSIPIGLTFAEYRRGADPVVAGILQRISVPRE